MTSLDEIQIAGMQLIDAPVEQLHESPKNPRTYFSEDAIEQMAESMRVSGIRVPLRARYRAAGGYEIGAGHRRLRAAKRAGLETVPVIVSEMTDVEFAELLAFDNSLREDPHALDEALGFEMYMRDTTAEPKDVAARLGQNKLSYVYGRLKLIDAIEEVRRAMWDGKISPAHGLLIARLEPKDQVKALKACEPPQWDPEEKISVRDLADWIKKNLHLDLKSAPFSRDSTDLQPLVGSCVACQYRSDNSPDFDVLEDLRDICTRPACYEDKITAHIDREKVRLQQVYGELILISENHGPRGAGVLRPGEWRALQASAFGAKPALMLEGGRRGLVLHVSIQESIPTPPAPAPTPKAKAAPGLSKEEKQRQADRVKAENERRREEEEQRRRDREQAQEKLEAERTVRCRIVQAILQKVKWPPQREDLLPMLEDVQISDDLDGAIRGIGIDPQRWGRANTEKLSEQNVARLIVLVAVADDFDGDWSYGRGCEKLNAVAKRYGVDALKVRAEAEGGTRKEVIKQLPAMGAAKTAAKKKKLVPAKKPPVKKAGKKGGKK